MNHISLTILIAFLSVVSATTTCQEGRNQLLSTYASCPSDPHTEISNSAATTEFITNCNKNSQFGCKLQSDPNALTCEFDPFAGVEICPGDLTPVSTITMNGRAEPIDLRITLLGDDITYDVYFLVDARTFPDYTIEEARLIISRTALHMKAGTRYGLGITREEGDFSNGFSHLNDMSASHGSLLQALHTKLEFTDPRSGDYSAALSALYGVATSSRIQWRSDARPILIYIGTQPGHEQACGPNGQLTRQIVSDALNRRGISVVPIDFGSLNTRPTSFGCGLPARRRARPNQMLQIASKTRGFIGSGPSFLDGTTPGPLYEAIKQTFNTRPVAFDVDLSDCGDVVSMGHPFRVVVQPGERRQVTSVVRVDRDRCPSRQGFKCMIKFTANGKEANVINVSTCRF